MSAEAVVICDIYGCARCHGEGHAGLVFRRLTHQFVENDGTEFTHWAPCPTNGEPILLALTGGDNSSAADVEEPRDAGQPPSAPPASAPRTPPPPAPPKPAKPTYLLGEPDLPPFQESLAWARGVLARAKKLVDGEGRHQ